MRPHAWRKGVVPSNVSMSKADEATSWSAPSLGDFTDESWDDLSSGDKRHVAGHYAWAAEMPPKSFGDLKLPHHEPDSGKVVWRGVAAAMGALMGARGGVSIPDADKRKVYDHLATHYRQFGKEPPEYSESGEEREVKSHSATVEFKSDEKGDPTGEFKATFSTLNVIDHDGDVTVPGAFQEGQKVRIAQWGHNWGDLPVGIGVIHTDGKTAWVEGKFFLDTQAGLETYKTVKNLGDLQEWSYGFGITKYSFGEFGEGDKKDNVRFLEGLDVFEVCPVMLGAGVGTRTDSIKGRGQRMEEQAQRVLAEIEDLMKRAKSIQSLRAKAGRRISASTMSQLQDVHDSMGAAMNNVRDLLGYEPLSYEETHDDQNPDYSEGEDSPDEQEGGVSAPPSRSVQRTGEDDQLGTEDDVAGVLNSRKPTVKPPVDEGNNPAPEGPKSRKSTARAEMEALMRKSQRTRDRVLADLI